ncbi:NAD(P)-dependent alcohol dehydrogenase [Candidatus Pseudothioglobus singularis]|nr:NAD(P)-dependent alcohol dehydrogenase [Candidatus Pseudothioglobus singularis]MDB4597863.1 NAD(P)-dependent alcohol dehydrogenase [Candidatus Pseudothioglobus singularis]
MKAQVLHKYDDDLVAPSWVDYEDVPDPIIEKSSDVIVRIGGAGVCRTDLHIIEGVWRDSQDGDGKLLPLIMGHENAGWIEDVGSEVQGLKKGDPVIVHPKITGGTCIACRRGHDMHGEDGAFPGVSCDGGYAEALKTSVRNIVKLPQTLIPKEVAAYADAGLTAYRAAKKASRHLLPGQKCVVIGSGGLGHIGIQVLRSMCAADIIVVDPSDLSLSLAESCGADALVKADGNEVQKVLELTNGRGAEAVLDFVAERGTTAKGLAMTRDMGSYYVIGYGEDINVSAFEMITTEKNIIGNLVGTWAELTELMELANRGHVHLATQEFSLENANEALQALNGGKVKGRAVLVP